MTPSERITLISDIADALADEDWSLIDLTLRQFGLRWSEQWNGSDKRVYVFEMIEDANDESLLSLAEHLKLNHPNASGNLSVPISTVKELIKEIDAQKELMIFVATGGPRIQQVNDEYKERRLRIIAGLKEIGIQDPNPFGDLWNWYGKWSDGTLPSYQSRRNYLTKLFQPLLDELTLLIQQQNAELVEPTGWVRVDRNAEKIIHSLEIAKNEEDFQTVGLLCREAIISLAQAVYNPEFHLSLDGVNPSETDAKRMLENFIAAELAGSSNEELRKYAKNAYQLAVLLQHKRTANFRQAALCVEATRSLINIIAIISGHRDS
ncbi:MAG: hypothetical protein KDJ65_36030 [Anaerolineae bacterium]|nr:hypothetical protein [Anaerolineae bacterium]